VPGKVGLVRAAALYVFHQVFLPFYRYSPMRPSFDVVRRLRRGYFPVVILSYDTPLLRCTFGPVFPLIEHLLTVFSDRMEHVPPDFVFFVSSLDFVPAEVRSGSLIRQLAVLVENRGRVLPREIFPYGLGGDVHLSALRCPPYRLTRGFRWMRPLLYFFAEKVGSSPLLVTVSRLTSTDPEWISLLYSPFSILFYPPPLCFFFPDFSPRSAGVCPSLVSFGHGHHR